MTLVRWQPYHGVLPYPGFNSLQRRMNRIFEEMFQGAESDMTASWNPRVDVTEFDDHYQVVAELPGLSRDEVKVELNDNTLNLSGEKKTESEKKERNLYVCERSFGHFRRSFQFPSGIDAAKIDANFKDGILTVTLPKVEEAKPRQIEVKVN